MAKEQLLILPLLFLSYASCKYFIIGPAQIIILKAIDCPEYPNQPTKNIFKLHMYNKSVQFLDVNFTFPFDFDETVGVSIKCSKINKQQVQQSVFSVDEDNVCETMNKYVGSFWTNIEEKVGIKPGVCPIKKGEYSVKNLYLDLDQMKVKMFLEGTFGTRILIKQFDKVLFCKDFQLRLEPKKN